MQIQVYFWDCIAPFVRCYPVLAEFWVRGFRVFAGFLCLCLVDIRGMGGGKEVTALGKKLFHTLLVPAQIVLYACWPVEGQTAGDFGGTILQRCYKLSFVGGIDGLGIFSPDDLLNHFYHSV